MDCIECLKRTKECMYSEYKGIEKCPNCEEEVEFNVIPAKGIEFTCTNCGETMVPCSLCLSYIANCNSGECENWILWSLVRTKNNL